ncbi:MAG TPA: FtsQ-type POTRA domain-containing protein, partial [Pyrinomonadaceae bacterium]
RGSALRPDEGVGLPGRPGVVRLRPPKLDLVLQLDAVLAPEAFAYLFGEAERVLGAGALALGDDEVGVDGRDDGAAAKDSRQKGFEWKSALPYVPSLLKVVLAVALGLLAYLGYRTAVSASFFKVRSVDVAGTSKASRDEIRAAVIRLSSAGVWQADLEVIAKELKGLPWVRDAVVTRVLPSGLRVRVYEREPRIIARTGAGRLVWVDDDAVQLGAATPSDEDFFVRGLEEGTGEPARRDNQARVAAALALKADWDKSGLSKRVSEIDLGNLEDVRVHLAGDDAGVQVVLGGQDYVKRFRNAVATLDEKGRTQNGRCVSYINMTTGRSAIFGFKPCAAAAAPDAADIPQQEPGQSAPAAHAAPARVAAPAAARTQPAKTNAKKQDAARPPAAAVRPRRAEAGREH